MDRGYEKDFSWMGNYVRRWGIKFVEWGMTFNGQSVDRWIEGMVISKKIDFLRRGVNLDGELRSSMGNDNRWLMDGDRR